MSKGAFGTACKLAELRNLEWHDLRATFCTRLANAGYDVFTIKALLVALPAVLPKLIDFLQSWVMRQHGRSVKFKGKISDRDRKHYAAFESATRLNLALKGLSTRY